MTLNFFLVHASSKDTTRSIQQEYVKTLKQYAKLDFGISQVNKKSVGKLIKEHIPISLKLGLFGMLLTYLLALPLGILKALNHRKTLDWLSTFALGGLYSIPPFATGSFLLFYFGNSLPSLILPLLTLTLFMLPKPTLLMKNALVNELAQPYVLMLKAKGASKTYITFRHCVKNAFLVTLSSFSHIFLYMFFYGTLAVEILFSLQGLGYLSFQATKNLDYPVILGCLYIYVFFGMICHIVSDALYSYLDKRVELHKRAI